MDNFIRNLMIKMLSTPKPIDPTAPRIPQVPVTTTPFGATAPANPSAAPSSFAVPTRPTQRPLTPSVSTSASFRLGAVHRAPMSPVSHPSSLPITVPTQPVGPMEGEADGLRGSDVVPEDPSQEITDDPLPSAGMNGMTLPPTSTPSGLMAQARAPQESPDLVSIIRKAISRIH